MMLIPFVSHKATQPSHGIMKYELPYVDTSMKVLLWKHLFTQVIELLWWPKPHLLLSMPWCNPLLYHIIDLCDQWNTERVIICHF